MKAKRQPVFPQRPALQRTVIAAGAALLSLLPGAAAHAVDQAIVIGVNDYPQLEGATLKGCVNDAQDMQATLRKMGFNVTILTNQQATRQGILNALNQVKARSKPSDKLVFYFAGHGTQQSGGDSVLLPHDASESEEAKDIKASELHEMLKTIPAASRTALLDSCYSGGMMRSFKGLGRPKMTTRFHRRKLQSTKKDFVKVRATGADSADIRTSAGESNGGGTTGGNTVANTGTTTPVVTTTPTNTSGGDTSNKVCYFTASSRNEQAGEDDFNKERHGVFTHFLVTHLNGTAPGKVLWGDLQTAVSSSVSEYMEDLQHPRLSPEFAGTPLFVNGDGKVPAPPGNAVVTNTNGGSGKPANNPGGASSRLNPTTPNSLWDLYSSDQADSKRILLSITPDETTLAVNQKVKFRADIGQNGYLILLNRGVSGNVNLLYPESGKVDDAAVKKGKALVLPEDGADYYPDRPGTERLKAVLFTSKELAADFLSKFNAESKNGTRSVHWVRLRDVKMSKRLRGPAAQTRGDKPFYTSDVMCEVVAQ